MRNCVFCVEMGPSAIFCTRPSCQVGVSVQEFEDSNQSINMHFYQIGDVSVLVDRLTGESAWYHGQSKSVHVCQWVYHDQGVDIYMHMYFGRMTDTTLPSPLRDCVNITKKFGTIARTNLNNLPVNCKPHNYPHIYFNFPSMPRLVTLKSPGGKTPQQ